MPNTVQVVPLRLMVASSVYGFETELDQICAVLSTYGYSVWNSHLGTIPTHPGKSNLENCLEAVRRCDMFLGIIRPLYGSGIVGARSITHEEMRLAVNLQKPRWFLVHDHVTFTRQLMQQFRFRNDGQRRKRPLQFKKTPVFDDLRVLDLYDDVVQTGIPPDQRRGHWAQEYHELGQVLRYIETQFADVDRVREIVTEMNTP